MPDITANLNLTPTANRNYSPVERRTVVLDLVKKGIITSATYDIFDLAVGEACTGGFLAVETTVLGGTSIRLDIGGDNVTGVILEAALLAGEVFAFGDQAVGATTGITGYAQAVAKLVSIVNVGVHTAGVLILSINIENLKTIIDANIT